MGGGVVTGGELVEAVELVDIDVDVAGWVLDVIGVPLVLEPGAGLEGTPVLIVVNTVLGMDVVGAVDGPIADDAVEVVPGEPGTTTGGSVCPPVEPPGPPVAESEPAVVGRVPVG